MALLEARFQDGDDPPILPADPYFHLETTTIFVSRDSGWALGNEVLKFFASETSLLHKLRRGKFAITVEAAIWMCATIKTRIYKIGEESYTIEMQRRSGDVVTFVHVFRKAVRFFQGSIEPESALWFDPAKLALYDL